MSKRGADKEAPVSASKRLKSERPDYHIFIGAGDPAGEVTSFKYFFNAASTPDGTAILDLIWAAARETREDEDNVRMMAVLEYFSHPGPTAPAISKQDKPYITKAMQAIGNRGVWDFPEELRRVNDDDSCDDNISPGAHELIGFRPASVTTFTWVDGL